MTINRRRLAQIAALLAGLALNGCVALPPDLGRSDVDRLVAERGRDIVSSDVSNLVASLTKEPLTAQNAIRLALINNPSLQANYVELGLGAAEVYAASRIRNPVFSGSRLDPNRLGELDQLTFGLVSSFTDLLTLGSRKRLARAEFAALKESIGAQVLAAAADADAAYYHYVGAKHVAALRLQIAKAGTLSETMAKRFYDAGNMSAHELALEQAAGAEARLSALSAQAEAYAKRTELATVLGLSVGAKWDALSELPIPLASEDELSSLLTLARHCRLDLAAARIRTDNLADQLGVTGWTRWLGELDIGYERERDTDGTRLKGPTLDWELPIFNQHRDELLRADVQLQMAILDVAQLTLDIDNDVHLAYAATQNAKARATTFRDQLIPARMAATARAQEEQSFMLIGIFEVLATKQQEYDAYQGYMESVRDYWLARAALTRAVGNTLPSSARIGKGKLDLKEILEPQSGGGHSGHNMSMSEDMKDNHAGHNMATPEPTTDDHAGHDMPTPDNSHDEHRSKGDQE